jgi:hypothetical protein
MVKIKGRIGSPDKRSASGGALEQAAMRVEPCTARQAERWLGARRFSRMRCAYPGYAVAKPCGLGTWPGRHTITTAESTHVQ